MEDNKEKEKLGSRLESYKKAVKNLAISKSDVIFPNKDAEHAAVVISNIIEHSDKEVRIFDDDLSGDVSDNSDELLDAIKKAVIEDKKTVKFLVRDDSHTTTKIYKLLSELAQSNENLTVKKVNQQFINSIRDASEQIVNENIMINFSIGDKTSFRIEFPNSKRKAFCSFNNPKISKTLCDLFESKFNEFEPVF